MNLYGYLNGCIEISFMGEGDVFTFYGDEFQVF